MNNKINIPEISNDLYEDMEMLLNQAEMPSGNDFKVVDYFGVVLSVDSNTKFLVTTPLAIILQ